MTDYSKICEKDISLRDYQQSAKESIFGLWNDVDNVLYQMPTGTGKTRLFTSLIRDIRVWSHRSAQAAKILIVAHRTELIDQIDRSLSKYHVVHGIIAGGVKEKRDLTLPVQVASIQTITHPTNAAIAGDLAFNFIIIDEAHHATAVSYTKLWKLYPNSKKLGVTATPWRMNNGGFRQNFDTLLLSMPVKEFMDKGWLAPYKYYSIQPDTDIRKSIDSIHEFDIEGDYKVSSLERIIDTESIRSRLVDSYLELAKGKKGIVYSISRKHSENICQQYRAIGVRIVSIDSETPAKIREKYVRDFKEGLIDLIVNVDIFSEGFDCPDIEFVQLARPTKSLVKYIQQVGRGLRKNGEKECIILDNVGLYLSFGFPDEEHPWQLYFDGKETVESDRNTNSIKTETRERVHDLTEGENEMKLLQSGQVVNNNFEEKLPPPIEQNDDTSQSSEETEPIQRSEAKAIRSKSFCNGKYVIESNEDGFFLIKVSSQESRKLTEDAFQEGVIIRVIHDRGIDRFTIIRSYPRSSIKRESIIGYLIKQGGILKFSSNGY